MLCSVCLRPPRQADAGVDRLMPEARSRLMLAVKSKDTKLELIVRSLLHRMGYRFRLHRRDLPGSPDNVFVAKCRAIFVHGCVWHGHGCRIGQPPKSRIEYWGPKIDTNKARDARNKAKLQAAGWRFLTVWQCALRDQETLELIDIFLGLTPNLLAAEPPAHVRLRMSSKSRSTSFTSGSTSTAGTTLFRSRPRAATIKSRSFRPRRT